MHADKILDLTETQRELDRLSEQIIAAAYRVQNVLGCGFLEKVYENALAIELLDRDLPIRQQAPYHVRYGEEIVGEYLADLVVSDSVIVEVKACTGLNAVHRMQCLNYLKAANLSLAILLNFGNPRLEIRRIVNRF